MVNSQKKDKSNKYLAKLCISFLQNTLKQLYINCLVSFSKCFGEHATFLLQTWLFQVLQLFTLKCFI